MSLQNDKESYNNSTNNNSDIVDDVIEIVDLEEAGDESDYHIQRTMYEGENYKHHHGHHHSHHHDKRHRRRRSKKRKAIKALLIILGVLLFIVLVAFVAFMVMSSKGKKELLNYEDVSVEAPEELDAIVETDGETVTYNGRTYKFNSNVASVVFIGVDKSGLGTETYGEAGQADAVYIYTYDTDTKKSKIICVSRETMVDVNIYSTSGTAAGIETLQLCLAYAYGDGREDSCENTLKSLSRIFYNVPFNSYIAIDWDAIAVLNDEIGGVEVNVLEDVYTLKKGTDVTLMGQDAFYYVQYRDMSYLESNSARLDRQKQYITNFANKVISATKKDLTVPLDLYGILTDYMVTNVTASQVSYIAAEAISSTDSMSDVEFISIEGETRQGEEHAEFYPDSQALYELILDVFYVEVEE